MIDEMIKAAKAWRPLARLEVFVVGAPGEQAQAIAVKLGEARRRWKRIAGQLAGLVVVGARGYDSKDELVGSWTAPTEPEGIDEGEYEDEDAAAHRQHTQWCLREAAKMHENSTKLVTELVGAVIDIVRALRQTMAAAPAAPVEGDEATRVLGQLLSAAMANQGNNKQGSEDGDEEIRTVGSPRSDADRQGQPTKPGEAGT